MSKTASQASFRFDRRAAGILLHPTSLPGPHGCGDLGPEAHRFVDFLAAARQRWWQVLPVGPIGPAGSPYSSRSARAGNPLLVSLEQLAREGLLQPDETTVARPLCPTAVHYPAVTRYRLARLRIAFERFRARRGLRSAAFERFCTQQAAWLDDYALFCALARVQRTDDWTRWPAALRTRRPAALRAAAGQLADELDFHRFVQFQFDRQWLRLRQACHARGVGLIGDLPIFVVHASVDVWTHPQLFQLDRAGRPTVVSGVPPDYFSRTGQLWGHPLYRWEAHRRDGFAWWIERLRAALRWFDAVRIDHFLGLNRCWAVPASHRTAVRGVWQPSPGYALLAAARQKLGSLPLIAEDLGLLTPQAAALRDQFDLPGMRILQFAFGGDADARYHQPHNYPRRCVAYTGTHDNETFLGWFRNAQRAAPDSHDRLNAAQRAMGYLNCDGREIHWAALRALYASHADLVVCPLQDVLGLDNRARMNTPATVRGNWRWRLPAATLRDEHAARLAELAWTYERG